VSIKILLIVAALAVGYVLSTWLLFGTARPCEILVARQKDHAIRAAEKQHREDLESIKELARKELSKDNYGQFVQNLEEYSSASSRGENQERSVIARLRQQTHAMTTPQCAWHALTWMPTNEQFTLPQN
jgi:hypothetical protein